MMQDTNELPALPDGWEWKEFGDIFAIQGGGQPEKKHFLYEPTDSYIRLLQIRDFGDRPVPTYIPEEMATKFCTKEDILIARYGASLGRILTGMEGAYNVAMAKVIFDKKSIVSRYAFYLLHTNHFQTPIHMISRSAQNGFNKGDVSPIKLPIAPLEEQRRIVEAIEVQFSRLDESTAVLHRLQQNIHRYRAALLKHACEGKLLPQDPTDEPADQLLQRILHERRQRWEATNAPAQPKNDTWKQKYVEPQGPDTADLPELPSGWVWTRFEQILIHIQTGPFGSSLHKSDYIVGGIPVINPASIHDGKIYPIEQMAIDEETRRRLQNFVLEEGDVLLGRRGEMGRAAIITAREVGWICGTGSLILKLASNVNRAYIVYLLRSEETKSYLGRQSVGTTMQNLNQTILCNMPIALPPLAEQKRIIEEVERRLTLLDNLQQTITTSQKRAHRLRQAILHRAFSGRLVPQNPHHDEPAPVIA